MTVCDECLNQIAEFRAIHFVLGKTQTKIIRLCFFRCELADRLIESSTTGRNDFFAGNESVFQHHGITVCFFLRVDPRLGGGNIVSGVESAWIGEIFGGGEAFNAVKPPFKSRKVEPFLVKGTDKVVHQQFLLWFPLFSVFEHVLTCR